MIRAYVINGMIHWNTATRQKETVILHPLRIKLSLWVFQWTIRMVLWSNEQDKLTEMSTSPVDAKKEGVSPAYHHSNGSVHPVIQKDGPNGPVHQLIQKDGPEELRPSEGYELKEVSFSERAEQESEMVAIDCRANAKGQREEDALLENASQSNESDDTSTDQIPVPPAPLKETSFSIGLQVVFPFLLAGFGTVAAGMVLDIVQVSVLK